MHEENVPILPTFISWISEGIGQRKTLVVQESKEGFPNLNIWFWLKKKLRAIDVALH